MSELEDRLSELRPAEAPEQLWERIRKGEPARPPRHHVREPIVFAVAASLAIALLYVLFITGGPRAGVPSESLGAPSPALARDLGSMPYRIVFETRRDGNGEIYRMNADGSNPVNLTRTPDVDECYPKASPDGTKIC